MAGTRGPRGTRPARVLRAPLFVVALAAVVSVSSTIPAASQSELAEARAQLERLEQQIESGRRQKESLTLQVEGIRSRIADGSLAAKSLDDQLAETREQISAAQEEAELLEERKAFVVRNAYMQGAGGGTFDVIFGSTSGSDFNERLDYLSMVALGSEQLAERVSQTTYALEAHGADLEQYSQQQNEALEMLGEQQKVLEEKSNQLQAAQLDLFDARDALVDLVAEGNLTESDVASVSEVFHGTDSATFGGWASYLLHEMQAPACHDNLVAVVAWQVNEFTDAQWNPLATTYPMDGASDFNSVGVKNYISLEQGLDATRLTLVRGSSSYGYGDVIRSLRRCADAMKTAEAIRASSWCYGCTYGEYVTGLIPRIEADFTHYARL
ncbi:MAG: hypothetical protein WD757_07760 [Actinomycetota bacterium]